MYDLCFALATAWRKDFRKAKVEVEKSFRVSFIKILKEEAKLAFRFKWHRVTTFSW